MCVCVCVCVFVCESVCVVWGGGGYVCIPARLCTSGCVTEVRKVIYIYIYIYVCIYIYIYLYHSSNQCNNIYCTDYCIVT